MRSEDFEAFHLPGAGLVGCVFRRTVMSAITFFNQTCQVCGRRLQIAVELLGQQVVCRHCRGRFVAHDASSCHTPGDLDLSLLERADQLIADTAGGSGSRDASRLHRSHAPHFREFVLNGDGFVNTNGDLPPPPASRSVSQGSTAGAGFGTNTRGAPGTPYGCKPVV